jgi:hypothetical protein
VSGRLARFGRALARLTLTGLYAMGRSQVCFLDPGEHALRFTSTFATPVRRPPSPLTALPRQARRRIGHSAREREG